MVLAAINGGGSDCACGCCSLWVAPMASLVSAIASSAAAIGLGGLLVSQLVASVLSFGLIGQCVDLSVCLVGWSVQLYSSVHLVG